MVCIKGTDWKVAWIEECMVLKNAGRMHGFNECMVWKRYRQGFWTRLSWVHMAAAIPFNETVQRSHGRGKKLHRA